MSCSDLRAERNRLDAQLTALTEAVLRVIAGDHEGTYREALDEALTTRAAS
jgi:hypothetical protein